MINNLFKTLFLAVAICATFLIYQIYLKLDNGRFQAITTLGGGGNILDTKKGILYLQDDARYFYLKDGQEIYVKSIPTN